MSSCRWLGHRFRFRSEDRTMTWECARSCGVGGSKRYPTAEHAARYAQAFDRDASGAMGRRAPLIGLLPLRLWRALRGERNA